MKDKVFRGSAIPRIMLCPASAKKPEIQFHGSSPIGNMGSAVHDVMAVIVREGHEVVPDVGPHAERHKVEDIAELVRLSWNGLRLWHSIKGSISKLLAIEEPMSIEVSEVEITGTADVVFESLDNELIVLDWKSGYLRKDYRDQVMCYLYMASLAFPGHDKYKLIIGWLRFREREVIKINQKELDKWFCRLQDAMNSDTYLPGSHCEYCPCRHGCKAKAKLISSLSKDLIALSGGNEKDLPLMSMDTKKLASFYDKIGVIENSIKLYRAVLTERLAEEKDGIVMEDGKLMKIMERKISRIDLDRAMQYMKLYFQASDVEELIKRIYPALKINKTKLLDIVGQKAEKGKGRAKIDFINTLKAWDALEENPIKVISITKPKEI